MLKGIVIIAVLLAMLGYALVVATSAPADKETHEAYQRWKERNDGKDI